MAVTVVNASRVRNQPQREGQLLERIVDVTFDSSYLSGGEPLTITNLGFRLVYGIEVLGFTAGATATSVTHVKADVSSETAPVLVAFTGAGVQVSNATDLTAITVRLRVTGLG